MGHGLAAAVEGAPLIAHDAEFEAVIGGSPELVMVVATDAHEGPVYVADEDALYFTTVPRRTNLPVPRTPEVAIKRAALDGGRFPIDPARVSTVCAQTAAANGMTLDGDDGTIVVCEQGTAVDNPRIARFDRANGELETVAHGCGGLPFNSPNDVVVHSDGSFWFTDPSYGHTQGFRPEPLVGDYVYRFDSDTGRVAVVADTLEKPNGLAFTPGERVLYVTDCGANQEEGSFYPRLLHHVLAFDVLERRRLGAQRLFAVTTPGFPDGIKVDAAGRVYPSSFSGVQVFNTLGELIGEIHLPGAVNFTFGGPGGNVLFITTDTAVWAAVLNTKGA